MARIHRIAGIVSLAVLGVSAPLVSGCTPQVVVQPAPAAAPNANTVTVVGSGEVLHKPDIARASIGVEVTAPTVAEATRNANQRMTELVAALEKMGVADKDIQTSNFSINFERAYPPVPQPMPQPAAPPPGKPVSGPRTAPAAAPAAAPAEPAGFYRVSNTVTLTIREIDKLGQVLDGAVAAGANNVWGVSFGLDKPEALEPEARAKAVADARARAEALAKLAGRTLGEVVSVSEVVRGGNYPVPMAQLAKASFEGVPIEAGQVAVSSQVEIVYGFADVKKPAE